MLEDCDTVPLVTACRIGDDEEGRAALFDYYANRCVTSSETEACILAIDDCSEFNLGGGFEDCFDENAAGTVCAIEFENECQTNCTNVAASCGDDSENPCAADVVETCLTNLESCLGSCAL